MKRNTLNLVITLLAMLMMSSAAFANATLQGWGADRINNRHPVELPPNGEFTSWKGLDVNLYVVGTGIDFADPVCTNRCTMGYNAINPGQYPIDRHGQATELANITAKMAGSITIHPVKVLNDFGSGTEDDIVEGLEWVAAQNVYGPKIVVFMVGTGGTYQAIEDALSVLVNTDSTVIVHAGNQNRNACEVTPARVPGVLTVATSNPSDVHSSFSNYGMCVDLYAPAEFGEDLIPSTNLALGLVAGVAAVHLSDNPQWHNFQVIDHLQNTATPDVLAGVPAGTPNLLLYIDPELED